MGPRGHLGGPKIYFWSYWSQKLPVFTVFFTTYSFKLTHFDRKKLMLMGAPESSRCLEHLFLVLVVLKTYIFTLISNMFRGPKAPRASDSQKNEHFRTRKICFNRQWKLEVSRTPWAKKRFLGAPVGAGPKIDFTPKVRSRGKINNGKGLESISV